MKRSAIKGEPPDQSYYDNRDWVLAKMWQARAEKAEAALRALRPVGSDVGKRRRLLEYTSDDSSLAAMLGGAALRP